MRPSLSKFIDTCYDVRTYFELSSYELHDYTDGAVADFKVGVIKDVRQFLRLVGDYECRIMSDTADRLIVRLFEPYYE